VFKRREQRRRIRRMSMITAFSLAMAVITTGLAISARNARDAAVQRQREAETLIDFMLGDLNNKLRQVQRLDILEAVDRQAMAYFMARPSGKLGDETLSLRVKALQKIGNVYQDQGDLPAAMQTYRAAADSAEELIRRAPGNLEHEAGYAEILHHLGNAYWFQGDLDRALGSFQKAISLLGRAQAVRPSDEGAALLAYARINEGRVQEVRGNLAAARLLYEDVLATFSALSARNPGESRWQSDLAEAKDSLAKVTLEQGQLTQAVTGYRDALRMRSDIATRDRGDRNAQESLLLANAVLGNALALCGDVESATNHVRTALAMARELLAFDATQSDWRFYMAKHSRLLGVIALGTGRLEEAARAIDDSLQGFTELVATDQSNMTWRRELARARTVSARLQLASGDSSAAERQIGEALTQFSHERASGTMNRSLPLYQAEALIALGEAAARRQDPAAREHWAAAREALSPVARIATDPETLATWVRILLLLEDSAAAQPVLERLGTMGYRPPEFDSLLKSTRQAYRTATRAVRCGEVLPDAPRKG
jgi:eukaryotic-like serine/threonine-protein kinase